MPMKLSDLLASRKTIVQQAALANLAYAYEVLTAFADRIANARLRGIVRLQQASEPREGEWPTLTALTGNQSVIDEHFTDSDILEMAEAVFFVTDNRERDASFPIEELAALHLAPLRELLEKSGVTFDNEAPARDLSSREMS